ncbi:methylmalonyl-CoA mutase family protein [Hymenobacter sp. H14-R3]|uniref:methylmalonyl-CoA mutase family protein n=1 Tax=Hymenobacter sp. H14-R3 TaxID=3046308 RepID=UPI0024BAA5F1|nr:methylmalonyl-CoA mutase family protein [Hymenobacter sp. H14-R3]MDJ0367241.1 methylmalonyl-CoA mutase family protein [Hymenobacter sp. H14-R3]
MTDSSPPIIPPVSFPEFAPVTTAQWQAQLTRELKGADPASLRWTMPDGLVAEPFYHREALTALGGPPAPLPPRPAGCRNVVALTVPASTDGRLQIEQGADALARGAEGLHFILAGNPDHFAVADLAERLPLATTWLGFTVQQNPEPLLERLLTASSGQPLRGLLRFLPFAVPEGAELLPYRATLRRCLALAQGWPDFTALAVNGTYFGNRGATLTQQLAFSLSTAAAMLAQLPDEATGLTVAEVARHLHLDFAVGPSYFPEMARLRAARRLWATLLHAFGLPAQGAATLPIHATTSTWTQTTLDPHTNLLRHTTEAMSAVLGGADSIQVAPFDCLFQAVNEFSARLARNLPIILRDEAHLDWVADPAAGSYFVETLTDDLARAAWAEFQALEAHGGMLHARAKALEDVSLAGLEKFKRVATGQDVIVGTNRFQNAQEKFDFQPKQLLRSRDFDTTRATYPSEVLRLATALHFERRANQDKQATLVLLGNVRVNAEIAEAFWHLLHPSEREASAPLPELEPDTYSVLFSKPEEATLMYARPEQFDHLARVVQQVPAGHVFDIPSLITADLATLLEAVRVFGFKEFVVEGHRTEEVLARLQGR